MLQLEPRRYEGQVIFMHLQCMHLPEGKNDDAHVIHIISIYRNVFFYVCYLQNPDCQVILLPSVNVCNVHHMNVKDVHVLHPFQMY